jgi:PAS domain S-box-containing protein
MVRASALGEFAADTAFSLVDQASDAAFAIDRSRRIVGWNRRAQQLLGYAAVEVIGHHCSDVLQAVYAHGEPMCVPGCQGTRCFQRYRHYEVPDCHVRHKDGGWIPANLASVVMSKHVEDAQDPSVVAVIFLKSGARNPKLGPSARTLRIFTLGRFSLVAGERSLPVEKWERKKALTLLKLLVVHLGRAMPREVLCEHLWPDANERSGQERLKVNVYALRRQLRSAGMSGDIVETAGQAYLLRRETVWVDAEVFKTCVKEGFAEQRQEQWEQALHCYRGAQRLYRGDYLAEDVHADWCAEERGLLHEIHLEMLAGMAECHAAGGRYEEAVSVCRKILVDDPCRESVHQALMEYFVRLGHIDSAMAQYRHCQRVLARELGVKPMAETHRLYEKIVAGEGNTGAEKVRRKVD